MEPTRKMITGLIEGLPASYEAAYVVDSQKRCSLCKNRITVEDINSKETIYIDGYDFCHKTCLTNKDIHYRFLKENDKTSPAMLLEKE